MKILITNLIFTTLLFLAASMLLSTSPFSQQIKFATNTEFDTGTPYSPAYGGYTGLSKGDFTNDGREDVLVFNPQVVPENITVIPGLGDGTLGIPIRTLLAQGPSWGTAGDFNEDNKLDVLGAITLPNDPIMKAQIYFGQGVGMFTSGPQYTGGKQLKVAVADFNHDQHIDMVLGFAHQNVDTFYHIDVYFGNGTGGMTLAQNIIVSTPFLWGLGPKDLTAIDFNNDGFSDLLWCDIFPKASLNSGIGTFGTIMVSSNPLNTYGLAAGQFNQDNFIDIAVSSSVGINQPLAIRTGLGQGNGLFIYNGQYQVLGLQTHDITVGDFNGDGFKDVLGGIELSEGALVLGHGNGNFSVNSRYLSAGLFFTPINLNNDSYVDLVGGGTGAGKVTVTLGTPNGLYAARAFQTKGLGEVIASGDINNDGLKDFVSTHKLSGLLVSVLLGRPQGLFDTAFTVPVHREAKALALGDLNNDEFDDLVVGSLPENNANLEIFLGSASGILIHHADMNNGSANAVYQRGISLQDVNRDQTLDIITATFTSLSVLPNNGNATFGQPIFSGWATGTTTNILAADYNSDSNLDIVTIQDSALSTEDVRSIIFVNIGTGNGTFNMVQRLSIDAGLPSAGAGLVDGDNKPDILVNGIPGSHSGIGGLYYLRNTGGQLALQWHNPNGLTDDLDVADFNGDGKVEVLAVDLAFFGGSKAEIYVNDGYGNFQSVIPLTCPEAPYDVLTRNLVGDSLPDIAILNSYRNPSRIIVYENTTQAVISVNENESKTPVGFSLSQNYPNPFNPTTTIRFEVPKREFISLKIFDILGREVAVLVNEELKPGNHEVNWEAMAYSSGIYFYCLTGLEYSETKKMLLIK